MRLIDADLLFSNLGNINPKNKQQYADIGLFMNMITNSKTEEKRANGEWLIEISKVAFYKECSICHCHIRLDNCEIFCEDYLVPLYCPNCGSRMKGR